MEGCARFRIQELTPNVVFSIPISFQDNHRSNTGIRLEGRTIYNIPTRPAVDGSYVYLSDSETRLVRRLQTRSGKLDAVYGPESVHVADAKHFNVAWGTPGWLAPDDDGGFFVQNFRYNESEQMKPNQVPPESRLPAQLNPASHEILPSIILHVNREGKILQRLHMPTTGNGNSNGEVKDAPFPLIEWMEFSNNKILYVLYKESINHKRERRLAAFRNGQLLHSFENLNIGDDEEKKKWFIEVEQIVPENDESSAILSAAYRDKNRFTLIQRKLFRVFADGSEPVFLHSTDDPQDYFSSPGQNGGFIMLQPEKNGESLLFKVYSSDGEYLNNRQIHYPGFRASWRETYVDLSGRIYSTRVNGGQYELYEWQ